VTRLEYLTRMKLDAVDKVRRFIPALADTRTMEVCYLWEWWANQRYSHAPMECERYIIEFREWLNEEVSP
jgi:hypothetical protein